jgi:hypothetical protein
VQIEIQEPLEQEPEACHCSQCRKQTGTYWMGCIDTPLSLKISKHIFVGDKGGYYEIADNAPRSPGF